VGEAAQLPDELPRRVADFKMRRRRLEVEKGLDIPTHGPVLSEKDID
jgi:hypothetical protein